LSPRLNNLDEFAFQLAKETEFNVGEDDFSDLEIRVSGNLHYFYDTKSRRLIKHFVLRHGPRVDTMCHVLLIRKQASFTPRLTFWKRDKSKGASGTLTESEITSKGREFIIKSRVDVGDCHENLWKLITFLQAYREVDLPEGDFRVTTRKDADLIKAMAGQDKDAVLRAVRSYLGAQLTEADVQLLLDRRKALKQFERLLNDSDVFQLAMQKLSLRGEQVWQKFFEENTWIFGYGLTLLACGSFSDQKLEQITSGANIFTGGGKRSDALMRTKGFIQTLLFAEIKRHDTDLLMSRPYRPPDVYQASAQLSGAVSQVQKTAYKAIHSLAALHRRYAPSGEYQFEVSTINPRQVVIAGNLRGLFDDTEVNIEKMTSFELYRRSQGGVEILTFDELYERSKFIVEHHEAGVR
jgi:hypothetical protein